MRAENKAEMLEKEAREVREALNLCEKKQIKPRQTPRIQNLRNLTLTGPI
nr:hypothetical protein [uncultured Desulfobacter sp.]